MSAVKRKIGKRFYDYKQETPVVKTVGQLIAELKTLPSDLPLDVEYKLTVYNASEDPILAIEDSN